MELNKNIVIVEPNKKVHTKASEEYYHVQFKYEDSVWDGWVPTEYRRTGVSVQNKEEFIERLNNVYEQLNPQNFEP